jgi:hypothetical protein
VVFWRRVEAGVQPQSEREEPQLVEDDKPGFHQDVNDMAVRDKDTKAQPISSRQRPLLPFKIVPGNGREARESGRGLIASLALVWARAQPNSKSRALHHRL